MANVTNTLVGRMPGLIAQQTSGDPGVDASSFLSVVKQPPTMPHRWY
ncbi:hypothetical protein [Paraflavitalea speifideaquila]|nr:hypothetical protein [Paraflavitalea speifideiaquila]